MAHLEVWSGGVRSIVTIECERLTVGRSTTNHVVIDEPGVSRHHAAVEQVGAVWSVQDLGSRNGTFVNGRRLLAVKTLHGGDEIRVGSHQLRFIDNLGPTAVTAVDSRPTARLTNRERDVLVALCRPVLAGQLFPEPASVRHIAGELFVSDAAVKQHLANLYEKLGISGEGESRRRRLATEALQRGLVTLADLQQDQSAP